MNDQLSPIERDVVLEAVETVSSPWIIQAKNNPNRIFVPQGKTSLHARSILFIPYTAVPQEVFAPILGIDAAVFFFYGGRGMFFSSKAQKTAQGTAFVISPAIYKQDDIPHQQNHHLQAKLYYNGFTSSTSVLNCESVDDYPLFDPYTWLHFSAGTMEKCNDLLFEIGELEAVTFKKTSPARESMEIAKRILYLPEHVLPAKNYFPFDAEVTTDDVFSSELQMLYEDTAKQNSECFIPFAESPNHDVHTICKTISDSPVISPFEILQTIMFLPGIRFLAEQEKKVDSVLGRHPPYTILYITESKIILGSPQTDTILTYGAEYPIALYADCGPVKREITASVKVTQRFDFQNAFFVAATLMNLKEEDKRFLYEKLYKTHYK